MVASSIPFKLSLCADRAHACEGDLHVSNGIDVACPTTQSVLAIASLHELHGDSWPSSSTGTSSFCCNHQYSVTAITTSAGAIAERYAYSAYGQPTILDASGSSLSPQVSSLNNRYTYTGREWDATLGLHHFRARWMCPSAGKFLGRDPIEYVESTNLYLSNLSFTRLDSSGKLSLTAYRIAGKDNKQNYCSQGNNNREYLVRYYLSEKPSCDGWLLREVCVSCGITECECKKQSNNPKDGFETKCYYEADRVIAADYEGQNGSVHAGDDRVGVFSSFSDSRCGKYSQVGITIFVCDEQLRELLGVNGDVDNNPETWKTEGWYGPEACLTTSGTLPAIGIKPAWWQTAVGSRKYPMHKRTQSWDWCCCGGKNDFWTSKSTP